VLALADAGCTHTVHLGTIHSLRVALSEYRVRPDNINARPGALTFEIRNYGRLVHNLVVSSGMTVLGSTRPIPPGGTATLTVTVQPGRYRLASTVQSDPSLGDHGSLTVTRR
jgi:hypothetical protein